MSLDGQSPTSPDLDPESAEIETGSLFDEDLSAPGRLVLVRSIAAEVDFSE
jgi:hypothetical protein